MQERAVADHLLALELGRTGGHGLSPCPGFAERGGAPPPDERSLDLEAFHRLDHHEPWNVRDENSPGPTIEGRQVDSNLPFAPTLHHRVPPIPRDADIDAVEQESSRRRAYHARVELQRDAFQMWSGRAHRGRHECPACPLSPLVLGTPLDHDEGRGVVDVGHRGPLLCAGELGYRLDHRYERAGELHLAGHGARLAAPAGTERAHVGAHAGDGWE